MSRLKFSIMLSTGVLLVGLGSAVLSQDAPPPRERADWDNAPLPGGPPSVALADEREPQPLRDDGDKPPRRPQIRADGDQPPPPREGEPRRRPRPRADDRDRPGPPDGPDGPDNGPPPLRTPVRGQPQPPGPGSVWIPGIGVKRLEGPFESLKTTDPELFKVMQEERALELQSQDLAGKYRRADKDEQAKIKEKLAEIVNKHFEVRQQMRNLEFKRLEQQLKQLRDKIEQREKKRQEIVAKRISELTGADEGEHF